MAANQYRTYFSYFSLFGGAALLLSYIFLFTRKVAETSIGSHSESGVSLFYFFSIVLLLHIVFWLYEIATTAFKIVGLFVDSKAISIGLLPAKRILVNLVLTIIYLAVWLASLKTLVDEGLGFDLNIH